MSADAKLHVEDLVPVRSRISWGAILGGSVLALALYFLMNLLGAATGLSISGSVSAHTLNVGAAIYAILITAVCLFIGGFYASRLTVGENGVEAATYGVLVWAVVLGSLVFLMATGVRSGFNAMMGVVTTAQVATQNTNPPDWEDAARRAGVPQERIADWKQKAQDAPGSVRQAVEEPQNKQAVVEVSTRMAWYTFIGMWISMMAAALGGYCGSGPTVGLMALIGKQTVVARPVTGRV